MMKNNTKLVILRAIYLLIGSFGMAFSFIGAFHISIFVPVFILWLVFYTVLYTYIFSRVPRAKFWLPICTTIYILLSYFNRDSIILGLKDILNGIIEQLNKYFNAQVYLYDTAFVSGKDRLLCMLVVMYFVSGLLAIAIFRFRSVLFCAFLYMPGVLLALLLGVIPPAVSLFFLAFSLLGVSILGEKKWKNKKNKKVEAVPQTLKENIDYKLHMTYFMWIITVIVTCIAWFGFFPKVYSIFNNERQLAATIQNAFLTGNVEEFFEEFRNLKLFDGPVIANSGMSGGVLGNASAIKDTNRKDLSVNFSQSMKGRIYLKGYVGSIYTGDSWEQLSDNRLDILEEMGGKSLFQLTNDLINDTGTSGKIKVIVDRVHASGKYVYLPYNTSLPDNVENRIAEAYIGTNNNRRFEYDFYPDNNELAMNLLDNGPIHLERDNLTPAEALESGYRDFVYENYMQVPESTIDTLRAFLGNLNRDDFRSLNECITFVRNILNDAAAYSKSPGATPDNEDFVTYFLTEQKIGYCMHFASAGTLLFRSMGIPARYVEGYTLADPEARKNIPIPDSSAHAWPEIYIDGYGWFPVEVTPGFSHPTFDFSGPLVSLPETTVDQAQSSNNFSTIGSQINDTTAPAVETERNVEESSTWAAVETDNISSDGAVIYLMAGLLVVVLLYIRYRYLQKRRINLFYHSRPQKSIKIVFQYICKLTKFVGAPLDEYTSPMVVEKEYPYVTAQNYETFIHLLYESRFSNHEITLDQQKEVLTLFENLVQGVKQEMNWWERFLCHFIYCFF